MKQWTKIFAGVALSSVVAGGAYFGAQPQSPNDMFQDIVEAEEAYFKQTGSYLQVMTNNRLPHYEQGTVRGKLGKSLPANAQVNTYRTPTGELGYQVVLEDETAVYSVGVGSQTQERTSTYTKPSFDTASTTP